MASGSGPALIATDATRTIYTAFQAMVRDDEKNEPLSEAGLKSFNHILQMTKNLRTLEPGATKTDAMEKFQLILNDPLLYQFDDATAESVRQVRAPSSRFRLYARL